MFRRNESHRQSELFTALLLTSGCDLGGLVGSRTNQRSQRQASREPKPTVQIEGRTFFTGAKSATPNLGRALDTLRARQQRSSFAKQWTADHGYPVWEKGYVFPQKDHLTGLVPVIRPKWKTVSGFLDVIIKPSGTEVYWLANGKGLKGKNRPTKETIETFALGFQKMIFGGLHRREDGHLYGQAVAGLPGRSPKALSSSVHIQLRVKHHPIEKRKAGPGDPVSMMSTDGYTSECWTYLYCTEPDGGWEKPLSEHTPDDPNCVLSDQWHGDCDGDVNWIPPGGSGGGSEGA